MFWACQLRSSLPRGGCSAGLLTGRAGDTPNGSQDQTLCGSSRVLPSQGVPSSSTSPLQRGVTYLGGRYFAAASESISLPVAAT